MKATNEKRPEWADNLKARTKELGLKQKDFVDRYDVPKSTVSKWFNGVQEPDSYNKNLLCEFLEVPDWNWFLSPEERDRLASERELKRFMSSTVGVIDTIGVGASKEALQILNETYSFLKTFGFEEVVKKFELQGETASIATLILEWSHVFYCFYQTFEPLLENYCSDKSAITELYRKEVELDSGETVKTSVPFGDELKNQLTELGKKYSFSLHGTFDELGNIIFDLYEKRPAPKEQGKRGSE